MNPNNPYEQDTPPNAPAAPPVQPVQPIQSAAPPDPQSYLDAIAEQPTKTRFLSGKMLVVLAGALVALILVVVIGVVANNSQQAAKDEITALGTKLGDLQTVLKYSQSNQPSNNQTVQVVAETNLISLSRQNELAKVYNGVSDAKASAASNKSITDELDDAKARGSLDGAYVEALRDQLKAACSQLEILYNSAKTDEQKTALQKAYDDFQEMANRLPATAS